jgi:hypothetical protein
MLNFKRKFLSKNNKIKSINRKKNNNKWKLIYKEDPNNFKKQKKNWLRISCAKNNKRKNKKKK